MEVLFDLFGHPNQRHEGQGAIRIAAANVGVDACEPDLLDPRVVDLVVEPDWMEGGALVVKRQRMPRAPNTQWKHAIAKRNRPDRPIDRGAKLLDRNAERFDGIKHAKEVDADLASAVHRGSDLTIGPAAQDEVIDRKQDVADHARKPNRRQTLAPRHRSPSIRAPSGQRISLHFGVRDREAVDLRRDQALRRD